MTTPDKIKYIDLGQINVDSLSDPDDDKVQDYNQQSNDEENEAILNRVTKVGPYQYLLLPVVWWCQITAVSNEVYMVFGGSNGTYSCINSTDQNNTYNDSESHRPTLQGTTGCNYSADFISFVPEWDLNGSRAYLPTLMTSMQLLGSLFGSLLGGLVGDVIGRYVTFVITMTGLMIFGIASSFSPSWQAMMGFRVVIGLFNGAYMSVAIVYMMECVSKDSRLLVEASLDCINSLGFCWLAFVAWLLGHWKWLSFITNIEVLPALLLMVFCFRESPRWLLQKGKVDRANRVVAYMASWNRLSGVGSLKAHVSEHSKLTDPSGTSLATKSGARASDLLRSPIILKYVALVVFTFFVTGTVGYGFIFNTDNLNGNLYLNFALLAIFNMVAALTVCFAEAFIGLRRKVVHQISLNGVWVWLLVIVVVFVIKVESKLHTLVNAAAVIGSMFSVPLWTISNLYSAELMPTAIRNVVNGAGNMAAKLGGIIAPQFVNFVIKYWKPAPYVVFGGIAIINAFVAIFFIPETKGRALPETEDDVRNFAEKRKS